MNREERKLWIVLSLIVASLSFGLGYVFWHPVGGESMRPLASKAAPVRPEASSHMELIADDSDFSGALSQLHTALQQHSGVSEQVLIRQANERIPAGASKPCPFEWRNGEAELVAPPDQLGHFQFVRTISSCTKAIVDLP